ncbi:hypothetical protein HPMBJEAJ_00383 [Aeromonas phage avDM6]|nr:hypothetical protein HPMBJEAJ_00383 [Aeromonas phage avDM6]
MPVLIIVSMTVLFILSFVAIGSLLLKSHTMPEFLTCLFLFLVSFGIFIGGLVSLEPIMIAFQFISLWLYVVVNPKN